MAALYYLADHMWPAGRVF